jgi:hypothetical protein
MVSSSSLSPWIFIWYNLYNSNLSKLASGKTVSIVISIWCSIRIGIGFGICCCNELCDDIVFSLLLLVTVFSFLFFDNESKYFLTVLYTFFCCFDILKFLTFRRIGYCGQHVYDIYNMFYLIICIKFVRVILPYT